MPSVPSLPDTLLGTPARAGKRPVINPARDEEQIAEGEYICVNRTPVLANLSIVGVIKSGEP
jgi:hypothetical protein